MIAALRLPLALLLLASIALVSLARAQNIDCSATMTNVSFGNVNPLSSQTDANATLNYTCSNSANGTRYATVCFSIGDGAQGAGNANPRLMQDAAGDDLFFQLFQNAAHTTVWGSSFFGVNTPVMVNVTIARRGSTQGSATMYGRVVGGQTTAVPGGYPDAVWGNHCAITIHEGKHRQIHRMIEALGHRVDKLQRVAFANLTFHHLRVGGQTNRRPQLQ